MMKRSYICHDVICMTVPLTGEENESSGRVTAENFLMLEKVKYLWMRVFRSVAGTLTDVLDGKLCNKSSGPKVAKYCCKLPILDVCGGSGCTSDLVYGFDDTIKTRR